MAFSIGGLVNKILDTFLPDIVGDIVGTVIDAYTGNVAGAAMNAADALVDVVGFLGGEEAAAFGASLLEGVEILPSGGDGATAADVGDASMALPAFDIASLEASAEAFV